MADAWGSVVEPGAPLCSLCSQATLMQIVPCLSLWQLADLCSKTTAVSRAARGVLSLASIQESRDTGLPCCHDTSPVSLHSSSPADLQLRHGASTRRVSFPYTRSKGWQLGLFFFLFCLSSLNELREREEFRMPKAVTELPHLAGFTQPGDFAWCRQDAPLLLQALQATCSY